MKIGYTRVSTIDQNPDAQRYALKAAGCENIITEKISGASAKRPKLEKLLRSLDAGDTLTVWRLDRVGRYLPHLFANPHPALALPKLSLSRFTGEGSDGGLNIPSLPSIY